MGTATTPEVEFAVCSYPDDRELEDVLAEDTQVELTAFPYADCLPLELAVQLAERYEALDPSVTPSVLLDRMQTRAGVSAPAHWKLGKLSCGDVPRVLLSLPAGTAAREDLGLYLATLLCLAPAIAKENARLELALQKEQERSTILRTALRVVRAALAKGVSAGPTTSPVEAR